MKTAVSTFGSTLFAFLVCAFVFAGATGNSQAPSAVPSAESRGKLTTPRIRPLEEHEWSAAQREFLKPGVSRSNNIKTCLYNLELCRRYAPFVSYFVDPSTLSLRDKEVLVLRTAWLCKADFIWNAHVRRAKTAGLTDADISAIVEGSKSRKLGNRETVLIRAVDELHSAQFITDSTWKSLAGMYDTPQLLETVFIVGQYQLLAMYQKSVGIPITGEVIPLPSAH
jgi:4-carboxymuconolactone decarboxylase